MILLAYIQNRYSSHKTSSVEEFTSASQSVKPGLIASGIVSGMKSTPSGQLERQDG